MPGPQYRTRSPVGLGLLYLAHELVSVVGMENIPVVTLATIIGQVGLYIGFAEVPWNKYDVCISAYKVLHQKFDWKVLVMSAFEHADDHHLYFNMVSFLMKGRELENLYGSKNFAILLASLTLMSNGMYVVMGQLGYMILDDEFYLKACAIGFSGVIFALKVITSCEAPPSSVVNILGFSVPMRYAAWVELIVIHILSPRSSFLGHLGGILVGLIYVSTPVGELMDTAIESITGDPLIHNECFYHVR